MGYNQIEKGVLLDNSIVVVENISRLRRERPGQDAAFTIAGGYVNVSTTEVVNEGGMAIQLIPKAARDIGTAEYVTCIYDIEKYLGGEMGRYFIGVASAVLILLPIILNAEGPAGRPAIPWAGCLELIEQGLSKQQQETMRDIENRYRDRVNRQRNEMMIKRIELQSLIRDPEAQEETIRLKADALGAVQDELRKTMTDYQIEIRRVLTSEQMRSWCPLQGEPGPRMGR